MADIFTKEKRSEIMSKIRSESGIERSFRKMLSKHTHPLGHRYRVNHKGAGLTCRPDIVFVSMKIAVFVDGDFWHGKNFKRDWKKLPKAYWRGKIQGNMDRDRRQRRRLRSLGWKVIRIWESDIRKKPEKSVDRVMQSLR